MLFGIRRCAEYLSSGGDVAKRIVVLSSYSTLWAILSYIFPMGHHGSLAVVLYRNYQFVGKVFVGEKFEL